MVWKRGEKHRFINRKNDGCSNDDNNLQDQLFEYQLTVTTMEAEMKSKEEHYQQQSIEYQNEIRKLKQENGHLHYKYIQSKQKQQQQSSKRQEESKQQPQNEPSLPTTTTIISTPTTTTEVKESGMRIINQQNKNPTSQTTNHLPIKNQIIEWISMLHKGDNLLFMYRNNENSNDENIKLVFKELIFLLMNSHGTKSNYELLLPKLIAMNAQLRSYLRTCITTFTTPITKPTTATLSRIQSKRRKGSDETATMILQQNNPDDDNWKKD